MTRVKWYRDNELRYETEVDGDFYIMCDKLIQIFWDQEDDKTMESYGISHISEYKEYLDDFEIVLNVV